MKKIVIASMFILFLAACVSPQVDSSKKEPACALACSENFADCTSGFHAMPISEHNRCVTILDTCTGRCPDKSEGARASANTVKQSTEERLKELKRLHDAGLISNDVYLEQQNAILGRP